MLPKFTGLSSSLAAAGIQSMRMLGWVAGMRQRAQPGCVWHRSLRKLPLTQFQFLRDKFRMDADAATGHLKATVL